MVFLVSVVVAATLALFILYLAYCTLRVAHENGKLAKTPWPVKAVCWFIFAVALVLDVVFNVTVGSVLFLEVPEWRRLTFTMRCKKHLEAEDFRGRIARYVCEQWLNPFEQHC